MFQSSDHWFGSVAIVSTLFSAGFAVNELSTVSALFSVQTKSRSHKKDG